MLHEPFRSASLSLAAPSRCAVLLALSFAVINGCGKSDAAGKFSPMHGHYGVASQWVDVDSGPSAKLFYRDDAGKLTLIWPYVGTRTERFIFHDDTAIFVT